MRLALSLALLIPGMLLLATPALPFGLLLIWGGWWVYERSRVRGHDDGLITVLTVLGGLGAAAIVVQAAVEAIARL